MGDRQRGVTKIKVKVPKCQPCKRSREQPVYIRELQRTLRYFFKMKSARFHIHVLIHNVCNTLIMKEASLFLSMKI